MPNQPEESKRIGSLMIDPLKLKNDEPGTLDNLGQPNIIDYTNHEPFLTSMSERGLGGGQPGTILPNNEPMSRSPKPTDGYRPGKVYDKMSGHGAVGADKSQPTIPTGHPLDPPAELPTENSEAEFDPVYNAWPQGEENPDHGCDCQMGKDNSTLYHNHAPTLYQQPTPEPSEIESSIGTGKQYPPDNVDTNITPRSSQAFSDIDDSVIDPIQSAEPYSSSVNHNFETEKTINLKVELVKSEEETEHEFSIDEPMKEWREALSIGNSGRGSAFSNTKKQEAITLANAGRNSAFSNTQQQEADIPREDEFSEPSVVVGVVKYFPEESIMEVELNGRKYPYYNVSYRDFDAFRGAPSKGKHYNDFFKGKFGPGRTTSALSNQEALKKAILYREAIVGETNDDFHWIDETALKEMIMEGKKGRGKYILLKAAEGAITDHRTEGEDFQRIITPELLKKLTYTAIKKGSDINHIMSKRDINSGAVIDAEFNDKTGFAEFIYFESDPEILQGIEDGFITAVSINGGAARSYKIINGEGQEIQDPNVQCSTGECFRLGEGIILGEKDNVAFTWVVTKPGFRYNGRMVPHTVPGVKTTKIFVLV